MDRVLFLLPLFQLLFQFQDVLLRRRRGCDGLARFDHLNDDLGLATEAAARSERIIDSVVLHAVRAARKEGERRQHTSRPTLTAKQSSRSFRRRACSCRMHDVKSARDHRPASPIANHDPINRSAPVHRHACMTPAHDLSYIRFPQQTPGARAHQSAAKLQLTKIRYLTLNHVSVSRESGQARQ